MQMEAYQKAQSRSDLSQVLVHFTKEMTPNVKPFDILRNILNMGRVLASKAEYITRYYSDGTACFYDVPHQNWSQLINTNPSRRRGYGIIVMKVDFWHKGGRPAIYTENFDPFFWPESERYRISPLDLCKQPYPYDWTHEREWRIRGDFYFYDVGWWPCVEKIKDAIIAFAEYNFIHSIYVIELGRDLKKDEIYF